MSTAPQKCVEPDATTIEALSDDQVATMTKALGHPVRLRIVRLLSERHTCVTGDLAAQFPLAQSTVSEHLRVLRDAGLIQGEIEGVRTSYCVNVAALAALKAALGSL